MKHKPLQSVSALASVLVLTGLVKAGALFASKPSDDTNVREAMPAVIGISGFIRSSTGETLKKHAESSGFFFDKTGLVLTVYSPYVQPETKTLCERFELELHDGRLAEAQILSIDPALNIAILKTSEEGDYAILDIAEQSETRPGEEVWAISGRRGKTDTELFSGRLKAKDKTTLYGDGFRDLLLNTYMVLPALAYGGPLVNQRGEVIGINMMVEADSQNEEKEAHEEHAVPTSALSTINKVLLANPTFEQNWLGFSIRYLNVKERALLRHALKKRGGISVDFVWAQGPAAEADIRRGDLLVGIDGQEIMSTTHFKGLFFKNQNDQPQLKIFRNGQVLYVQVRKEKRPPWAAL